VGDQTGAELLTYTRFSEVRSGR